MIISIYCEAITESVQAPLVAIAKHWGVSTMEACELNGSAKGVKDTIPITDSTYLFVFLIDTTEGVEHACRLLSGFSAWKQCASVLVFISCEIDNTVRDRLVDAFDKASHGSLGKLKIVCDDNKLLLRLFEVACTTNSLSKTPAGYWRWCPEEPVIWMCNYDVTTDIDRLAKFKSACTSVSLPFGNGASMASVRYGLINADLPKWCYVMLLVHLTDKRAESFAADLVDMEDPRIERLAYCLYSGGGCSEDTVNEFCTVLGTGRRNQCQRIPQVVENAEVSDITGLCAAFFSDAKTKTLGPALEEYERKQRSLAKGTVYLTSLSILCQGYLMVQCSEGGRLDTSTPGEPVEIAKIRAFAAKYLLPRTIKEHCAEVEAKEYWEVFDDLENLDDHFKAEWESKPTSGYEDTQPLVTIVGSTDVTVPGVVVNAYCAIVKRLGGKP